MGNLEAPPNQYGQKMGNPQVSGNPSYLGAMQPIQPIDIQAFYATMFKEAFQENLTDESLNSDFFGKDIKRLL